MIPITLYKDIRKLEKYIGVRVDDGGDRYLMGEILVHKKQLETEPNEYYIWLRAEYAITKKENFEMKNNTDFFQFHYLDDYTNSELNDLMNKTKVDWRDKL